MIKNVLIIILFLFSYVVLYADCRSFSLGEARQVNYETSNIIFLGISMTINNNNGEFLVLEKFKGDIEKKVVVNFSNYFNDKDIFTLWLIYGNKTINSDTIYVDVCSISRSIDNPHILNAHSLPPPMNEEDDNPNNIFLNKYLDKLYENQWRNDFYDEIELLRGISNFENNLKDDSSIDLIKEYKIDNYIILGFLILILFFNVLIFFKRK